LDIVEELLRYTHGDPKKVATATDKTMWRRADLQGPLAPERATYLYEDNIAPGYEMMPWADNLGRLLAEQLALAGDLPVFEPLPNGARGAILLTGDDDIAWLSKYDEQIALIGDLPISYLLLPQTNHTPETLAKLPSTVEFGVHVDALDDPTDYFNRCRKQTDAVNGLTGRSVQCVRNHGHLNDGYWGHLAAWEACGLTLDLNVRAIDGMCPTGSYLPFRVRRQDGTWSMHHSLFSTFSDSMHFVLEWPESKQRNSIEDLANKIDRLGPGIIVVNCHPQNVSATRTMHVSIKEASRRRGWMALGGDSLANWLNASAHIRLAVNDGAVILESKRKVENLAYRWPARKSGKKVLPNWNGALVLGAGPGRSKNIATLDLTRASQS